MPVPVSQRYAMPYQQPVNGLVSVTGIDGARAYQLPPNSSMPLFDADRDVLYVKTTDAGGYPTIRTFEFKPVDSARAEETRQGGYVTRSEYDALVAKVEELAGKEAGVGK